MNCSKFDDSIENRKVKKLADTVRHELLKYVEAQTDQVSDDIKTDLLVDCCLAHFELTPHQVCIPGAMLLTLSNMLRKNISKLSINDQDLVQEICSVRLKEWTTDEIKAAEEEDALYVMTLNTRFLLKEMQMTVCPTTMCPVPPRMSSLQLPPGQRFGPLVQPFVSDDTRFLVFEKVFTEISTDLQSTNFVGLQKELENELGKVAKPGSMNQNYTLAHRITAALQVLAECQSSDTKETELLDSLRHSLQARQMHRASLEQLAAGLRAVELAKQHHEEELQRAIKTMDDANKFSLTLDLPAPLRKVAEDHGTKLRLEAVSALIARRDEFARSDKGGLAHSLVVTYPLKRLVSKKVVVECGWLEKKDVSLMFSLKDGGVEITVLLRRSSTDSIVQKISLSEERLRVLRKADEGDIVELPSPEDRLLSFTTSKLVELLSDAAAGR
mmetsp:Transcript_129683/g.323194  ORF Transcript_129683/g.323194 Transcript_129683/m.323194 type:complete len:442 (+) Transcript_129683:3-1328(+)